MVSRRLQEEGGSKTGSGEAGEGLGTSSDGNGGASGSLDLAIRDLGDDSTSTRGSLDLAISDLGDGSTSSRGSLDLAVGDLGDGSTSGRGNLNLAVGDLGNRGQVGGSLELSVRNLADGSAGSLVARGAVSLNLAVTDLAHGDRNSGGLDLGLAIVESGDNGGDSQAGGDGRLHGAPAVVLLAAARHGDNLDGLALLGPVAVVEVVEVTRAALVENGGRANGQGAVLAGRETSSVESTSLGGRAVELELVVGDDGADAALAVGQDTILEIENEGLVAGAVTLLDRALAGASKLEDADLKLAVVSASAALGSRALGLEAGGGALRNSGDGGSEAKSGSSPLHFSFIRIKL